MADGKFRPAMILAQVPEKRKPAKHAPLDNVKGNRFGSPGEPVLRGDGQVDRSPDVYLDREGKVMASHSPLQAWREAGIRCQDFDEDAMEMTFSNGVVLPVICFLDSDRIEQLSDPIDGGWAAFGNDQYGFGFYPTKLVPHDE